MLNSFNNSVSINDQTPRAYPRDILDRNYLLSGDYDVFATDQGVINANIANYIQQCCKCDIASRNIEF